MNTIRHQERILANIGAGPFGLDGWVNLDVFQYRNVTLPWDSRFSLPFSDRTCAGIHVEHFFEHLDHSNERWRFLAECLRSLQPGGVLRIVVPDAERFVRAYVAEGWDRLEELQSGHDAFDNKIDALNHVFLQGHEHYGGYDSESMFNLLTEAGFSDICLRSFRDGTFPGGPIDREQHALYSLYMEAIAPATGGLSSTNEHATT